MIITQTIRKLLRVCVLIPILAPALALAVVADPSQLLAGKSARYSALAVAGISTQEEMVTQLMVKPRLGSGDQLKTSLRAHDASRLAKLSKVSMSVVREMSGNAHVIRLDQPVTLSQARAIAARLMGDNSVELAEPDRRKRPALTPTDPLYAMDQWNLQVPATTNCNVSNANCGGANLPNAWNITTGSNSVTVAVIDTGYRPHQDFGTAGTVVLSTGYTFITDIPTANNGVGREPDALDPGDWITGTENTTVGGPFYGCGALNSRNRPINQLTPSSWHGTHVSGIIAAQMNNGIGIAGIAPNIQILPVRVLGKCGGYDSDIIDGMRWAAGIPVAGVPTNTKHQAKVLNMSLGGSGGAPCSAAYQSAVNDVLAKKAVIVVAAGNDGTSTLSTPANCTGVIAVTANSIDGDNAYYATIGPGTTISAPGGDCGGTNYSNNLCTTANSVGVYSLLNSGINGMGPAAPPGGDIYVAYSGTSMATPHVSAVAALMFSLNPLLTPAQITSYLQISARTFPSGTICGHGGSGYGLCGAGLLDAYQALIAVQPSAAISSPVVTLGSIPSTVATGTVVTLSGSAITASGLSITYAWKQVSGPTTVSITNPTSNMSATATFTAPTTTGTYSFQLTATDSSGQTGTATAVIVVSAPPAVVVTLSSIPSPVTAGTVVTLSGSATSASGGSITYAWTQVSGPTTVTLTNNPGSNAIASFTPTTPGSYTFKLTATNSGGQTGSASVVILVNPSTPDVILGSIPTSVTTGTVVTLSGSAVAVSGRSITSYAWTQLSGPATVTLTTTPNSNTASFTPTTVGSYSFLLTATDNSGQTGTATAVINVTAPTSIAPPISGGKGGSMDIETLAFFALIAAGLRLRRRFAYSQK